MFFLAAAAMHACHYACHYALPFHTRRMVLRRLLSTTKTQPSSLASAWTEFQETGRRMAPLYAVMITIVGASAFVGGKIYSLEEKIRTTEEKIKTARAEAFEDASQKFLTFGYAAEYSRYQAKTVPDKVEQQKQK